MIWAFGFHTERRIALQLGEQERLWDIGLRIMIISFQWARI